MKEGMESVNKNDRFSHIERFANTFVTFTAEALHIDTIIDRLLESK